MAGGRAGRPGPEHPAPRFFRKHSSAPGSLLGSLRGKTRGSWPRPSLTCVRAHVPLEVEGVVEALAAEAAQVPLHLAVALEVPVEHALQAEGLAAQVAGVNRRVVAAGACGELGQRERGEDPRGAACSPPGASRLDLTRAPAPL